MLFLIEYDRSSGLIVNLSTFDDSDRKRAEDTRLETELDLNRRGVEREVVLLQAGSAEALRRTHRRYFETLSELARAPGGAGR